MKLITAIIQPTVIEQVQIALAKFGVKGMTVSEASGYGRTRGGAHKEVYRGTEFTINFISKAKLEVLAHNEDADAIIAAIIEAARTDTVGDGKIWVVPVEEVIRIRTGETGEAAI
jgi:nitrogen regulatory protein P-II 1